MLWVYCRFGRIFYCSGENEHRLSALLQVTTAKVDDNTSKHAPIHGTTGLSPFLTDYGCRQEVAASPPVLLGNFFEGPPTALCARLRACLDRNRSSIKILV